MNVFEFKSVAVEFGGRWYPGYVTCVNPANTVDVRPIGASFMVVNVPNDPDHLRDVEVTLSQTPSTGMWTLVCTCSWNSTAPYRSEAYSVKRDHEKWHDDHNPAINPVDPRTRPSSDGWTGD